VSVKSGEFRLVDGHDVKVPVPAYPVGGEGDPVLPGVPGGVLIDPRVVGNLNECIGIYAGDEDLVVAGPVGTEGYPAVVRAPGGVNVVG